MQKEDCKCNRLAAFFWGVEMCLVYLRSIHAIGIEWWKILLPFFALAIMGLLLLILHATMWFMARAEMKRGQEARHREAARLRREDSGYDK